MIGRSIGGFLDRNQGVGPGFDFLRLALAISIVVYHSFDVTHGPDASSGLAWLFIESLLPMFFALSGFLVTASAQRLSLSNFLINRGLRIFPALLVEIIFSAVLLGGDPISYSAGGEGLPLRARRFDTRSIF
jgi:peptidoglycan/LPS O-acetylase OafA/YrhL